MAATKSQPFGEGLAPDLGVVFSQSTPITIADNPSRPQGLPSRAALARRWPGLRVNRLTGRWVDDASGARGDSIDSLLAFLGEGAR